VLAAGGSSLAVSHDSGVTFKDVLLQRLNHVAIAPFAAGAVPIAYALGDNTIFVSPDGGNTWIQDQGVLPDDIGGAVGFANSQAPSVMVVSPRSPLELFLVGNSAGGRTIGPIAASDPFVSVYKDQHHFTYLDKFGTIWDAFWNGDRWNLQQINAGGRTDGPAAALNGGLFASPYKQQHHIAYQDSVGAIWDAFWNGSHWDLQQLNNGGKTNGPLAIPAGGPFVSVYKQQQHFAWQDSAGTIWDAFWDGDQWTLQQINAGGKTDGPAAISGSGPFVSVYKQQQHFAWQDSAGTIWDAFWNGDQWRLQQINAGGKTDGAPAIPTGGPFVSVYKDQQHFAWQDNAGNIWDAFWNSSKWSLQQINNGGKTTTPPAVPGSGPFVSTYKDQQHFVFQDASGKVWDSFWNSDRWSQQKVSDDNHPAAIGHAPFVSVYKDQQHFSYIDSEGFIWDPWWDSDKWNFQLINSGPMLWRGDYTLFMDTKRSSWKAVPLPDLGDQDSGNVFLATTRPGNGDLLFYGPQRSTVYVGPLDPASASDWHELDDDHKVHPDLHDILLSPNFAATMQNGKYQLPALTSGPAAAAGPFLSAYKQQHHFAYADNAGTIWDAFWDSDQWRIQQINAGGKTSGPLCSGTTGPFLSVYKDQQHFTYTDGAGAIWDAFWNSDSWNLQELNEGGKTNGPPAEPNGGPFASPYKQQHHFAYQDSAGTIWDAFWNGDQWHLQQTNAGGKTTGPAAVPGGGPFVSVYKDQQHFAYLDSAGTIWDAFWNSDKWNLQQINSGGKTTGPAAVPGGGPFVSPFNDQQHFAYLDSAGTIWDAFWNSDSWNLQKINMGGKTAGPAAAPGGGPFVCVYKQQQHFAYTDAAGTIWDAWWDSDNSTWSLQQINAGGKTDGPAAAIGQALFVSVYKQQQHFAYRDNTGIVWDAFWNGDKWNLQQINGGGTLWLLSDGGLYRSTDGGRHFQPAQNLNTLSTVNFAGAAIEGKPPVFSLNTGDNDGFFSHDGGATWVPQDYGGGDNDCSFADPLRPHSMLVFTPRWDSHGSNVPASQGQTVTVYETTPGGLPNAAKGTNQFLTVPPPHPNSDPGARWNAGSRFVNRGFRPLVRNLPGDDASTPGDYVFIRFKSASETLLLRTQNIGAIQSASDWDTKATSAADGKPVFQQGPPLPQGVTIVQASGGHTGPVFYVGDGSRLFKSNDDLSDWTPIVPGGRAKSAVRFFVDPYRPDLVYILDATARHIMRSDDGGASWHVDQKLEKQLTAGHTIPLGRNETLPNVDHVDAVLSDMQFHPFDPLARIAVGFAGVFQTADGVNWTRLLDTSALPGRPGNCYFDFISNPAEPAVYVGLDGRGLVKIASL
jgi:hypothetical protein